MLEQYFFTICFVTPNIVANLCGKFKTYIYAALQGIGISKLPRII